MAYKFSISQTPRRQERYDQVNDQILDYIKQLNAESDAETLWFGMRANGSKIGQSTFNNRLKKIVEVGLIEKKAIGSNKFLYAAKSK